MLDLCCRNVYAPPDITKPNITTIWWREDLLNFFLAQQFSPSSRNLLDGFYWETLSTKYTKSRVFKRNLLNKRNHFFEDERFGGPACSILWGQ